MVCRRDLSSRAEENTGSPQTRTGMGGLRRAGGEKGPGQAMDITSFSKCWSTSQPCCRDEVIKQRGSDLEISMSRPDREEKRTCAGLILIPGQRQETG